ncbi:class I SAM-dependent methyltransferase [Halobacterium jilantaiense]|uniref:Methyltransferase domain-containing protein n=1 Tax=Halobacterium jilantaiense TaxID=355548 RepID=A0A1I0NCG7_9EURY|nr:methyltransferase domain-containing protein [Halobacterium jilantaiense]SEV98840.1 Methyltransferase domain-containing protein [Halobacterium jilantaiense]
MTVSETQAAYGRWARAYDWFVRLLPGLDGLRAGAVADLDLERGDTVVDLGCGTGANLPHLREAVGPTGTVVGVDLTPGMLAAAERRIETAGWRNVHLVQGDAARPPVDGVDGVLGTFVVGMLADPAAGVRAWLDRLTSGGRVAVLEATRTTHPAGGVLNPVFDSLVAAGAPGNGSDSDASRTLDARVTEARDALAVEGSLLRDERRVAGFVRTLVAEQRA